MKKNLSFGFFLFVSIVILLMQLTFMQCTPGTTDPGKNEVRKLSKAEAGTISSSSQFGFNLIRRIDQAESGKNIIISPLSVSTAFGMVLNGAHENTYEQIKSALSLNFSNQDEVNNSYKSVNELLPGIDNQVLFTSANSIWYRSGFSVEKNFLDVNKNFFNAQVNELDFSNPAAPGIINEWVKQSTNSKIEKIIDQIDSYMVMYLINAIYFKGTWKYKFDESVTRDDNFYIHPAQAVDCKMMAQKNNFDFYENVDYRAVNLPYGDGSFNMMILLPSETNAVDNLLQNFGYEDFQTAIKNFAGKEMTVFLPRFKLEYERKLNDDLIGLGMSDAFNSDLADFTLINKNGGIYISEVMHKTFIEVNEEGTEAAAVTSIGMRATSVGDETYFRVDRPFMFIIYESNTNAVLFIGKIVNPTGN